MFLQTARQIINCSPAFFTCCKNAKKSCHFLRLEKMQCRSFVVNLKKNGRAEAIKSFNDIKNTIPYLSRLFFQRSCTANTTVLCWCLNNMSMGVKYKRANYLQKKLRSFTVRMNINYTHGLIRVDCLSFFFWGLIIIFFTIV